MVGKMGIHTVGKTEEVTRFQNSTDNYGWGDLIRFIDIDISWYQIIHLTFSSHPAQGFDGYGTM